MPTASPFDSASTALSSLGVNSSQTCGIPVALSTGHPAAGRRRITSATTASIAPWSRTSAFRAMTRRPRASIMLAVSARSSLVAIE